MQRNHLSAFGPTSPPRAALPTCLLIVGLFSVAMWQNHPVTASTTSDRSHQSATKSGTAAVYFVDRNSRRLVASQSLHASDTLNVPSGYVLVDPDVAANIQDTLAAGFDTSITLQIARHATAAVKLVTANGTVVQQTTLTGLAGDRSSYPVAAPSGYHLASGQAATVTTTLSADTTDDLTVHLEGDQPATKPSKPATKPATATSSQPKAAKPATRSAEPKATSASSANTATKTPKATGQVTFHYVADGPIERLVASQTLHQAVGTQATYTAQLPQGYVLAADQKRQIHYGVTEAPQVILIHLAKTATIVEAATPQVALATVVIVDDRTDQILATKAIFGALGERIVFDSARLVAAVVGTHGSIVSDDTKATAAFSHEVQRFVVRVAMHRDEPYQHNEAVPFGDSAASPATDQSTPALAGLPAGTTTTATPRPRKQLPPVIISHSHLFPETVQRRGGGDDARSGLGAYFLALSGKINFGIRASGA